MLIKKVEKVNGMPLHGQNFGEATSEKLDRSLGFSLRIRNRILLINSINRAMYVWTLHHHHHLNHNHQGLNHHHQGGGRVDTRFQAPELANVSYYRYA